MAIQRPQLKLKRPDTPKVNRSGQSSLASSLGLLAPSEFQRECYFEAWVRYVEDRRWAIEASEDLNKVAFPYDISDGDDLDHPGSTAPYDGDGEEGGDDDPNAWSQLHPFSRFPSSLVLLFFSLAYLPSSLY